MSRRRQPQHRPRRCDSRPPAHGGRDERCRGGDGVAPPWWSSAAAARARVRSQSRSRRRCRCYYGGAGQANRPGSDLAGLDGPLAPLIPAAGQSSSGSSTHRPRRCPARSPSVLMHLAAVMARQPTGSHSDRAARESALGRGLMAAAMVPKWLGRRSRSSSAAAAAEGPRARRRASRGLVSAAGRQAGGCEQSRRRPWAGGPPCRRRRAGASLRGGRAGRRRQGRVRVRPARRRRRARRSAGRWDGWACCAWRVPAAPSPARSSFSRPATLVPPPFVALPSARSSALLCLGLGLTRAMRRPSGPGLAYL
jgi:hypothetical protein